MQILINQVATELSTLSNAITLPEILIQINPKPPFAIAKNGVFIPKKILLEKVWPYSEKVVGVIFV